MEISRRDLHSLWAMLIGFSSSAEASNATLPSRCYEFSRLPAHRNATNNAETRQVFRGVTNEGCPVDLHITTLPPGQMPHPAHHHSHEEIMFVAEGKLEATISGKSETVGPGSVIYVHSNEEHGIKSVGEAPARYFVLALGVQQPAKS